MVTVLNFNFTTVASSITVHTAPTFVYDPIYQDDEHINGQKVLSRSESSGNMYSAQHYIV